MNPTYGIIFIGALAGWIASKIMETHTRQGAVANLTVGVIGALVGGFILRELMGGDGAENSGLIACFLIAMLGACILVAIWKDLSHRV